jgi:hypothetical protein
MKDLISKEIQALKINDKTRIVDIEVIRTENRYIIFNTETNGQVRTAYMDMAIKIMRCYFDIPEGTSNYNNTVRKLVLKLLYNSNKTVA